MQNKLFLKAADICELLEVKQTSACWIRNMRKRRNKRWLVTDMENTTQRPFLFG